MQTYYFKAIAQVPYSVEIEGRARASTYQAAARVVTAALMEELKAKRKRRRIDGPIVIKVERIRAKGGNQEGSQ